MNRFSKELQGINRNGKQLLCCKGILLFPASTRRLARRPTATVCRCLLSNGIHRFPGTSGSATAAAALAAMCFSQRDPSLPGMLPLAPLLGSSRILQGAADPPARRLLLLFVFPTGSLASRHAPAGPGARAARIQPDPAGSQGSPGPPDFQLPSPAAAACFSNGIPRFPACSRWHRC